MSVILNNMPVFQRHVTQQHRHVPPVGLNTSSVASIMPGLKDETTQHPGFVPFTYNCEDGYSLNMPALNRLHNRSICLVKLSKVYLQKKLFVFPIPYS